MCLFVCHFKLLYVFILLSYFRTIMLYFRLSESKPDWRWQLTASGRFAHRKDYVVSLANQNSFRVLYYESIDGFRSESGKEVRGHLFVLNKDSSYTVDTTKNDEL